VRQGLALEAPGYADHLLFTAPPLEAAS
jgi:hypothetical protein